jgi:hypothetical protein
MNTLTTISKYLDIAGPLLGLLLCLQKPHSKQKAGGYFIIAYLSVQLLANCIAKYMMHQEINNIRIYQANAFFSLIIVSGWFLLHLKNKIPRNRLRWLQGYRLFAVFLIIPIMLLENSGTLNSLSLSFTSFSICLYSAFFYLANLANPDEVPLLRTYPFWIATAFFLYYSTCFFIYVTFKIFAENVQNTAAPPYFMILWSIHNFILFISCCILGFSYKKIG